MFQGKPIFARLVVVVVLLESGSAQDCLTGIKDGPELPTFPDQFSVEIEANIIHLNLTLHVTEYYDNINQRGRIESYSAFGFNVTFVNYDTMEVSHIMTGADGEKSCMAAPLANDTSQFARFIFGAHFANGTAHIISTTQFLMFGAEFNETYIGIETVRGVPCHRWQSCNVTTGSQRNYTIDYYFTQTNWSYNPVMIPFQVVINGTRPERNVTDGSIHEVYNVYSFVNFRPGPADDELFRVPPGLPCLGRQTGKPLPPLPQDYYTVLYETASRLGKEILYMREYYGFSQQLYRVDYATGYLNSSTIIEDFNEGVQYLVDYRYGTCDINPINASSTSAVAYSNGSIYLEGLKKHFFRQDQYNYTYEGFSRVRDVDTESWISPRDNETFSDGSYFTNGFVQIYYVAGNWSIATGLNITTNMTIPWKIVLDGNFTYQFGDITVGPYYQKVGYNMLEFKTSEPNYDPFDVSVCFGVDQYTLLRLTLPLPDGTPYTSLDHSLLRARIRLALSEAANIPATRLGAIEVFDRDDNSLLVNLNVLDTPPYSIHNNTSPRDEIVSTLMDKVNSGKVNITLGGVTISPSIRSPPNNTCHSSSHSHPTATTSMTHVPSTVTVTATMTSTIRPSPTCAKVEESKGISSGGAAGLSVGLFLVGILVGIVPAILIMWITRRRKSGAYSNLQ